MANFVFDSSVSTYLFGPGPHDAIVRVGLFSFHMDTTTLWAASPRFRTEFQKRGYRDKDGNETLEEKRHPDVFHALADFIYGGQRWRVTEHIEKLGCLAKCYAIKHLPELLEFRQTEISLIRMHEHNISLERHLIARQVSKLAVAKGRILGLEAKLANSVPKDRAKKMNQEMRRMRISLVSSVSREQFQASEYEVMSLKAQLAKSVPKEALKSAKREVLDLRTKLNRSAPKEELAACQAEIRDLKNKLNKTTPPAKDYHAEVACLLKSQVLPKNLRSSTTGYRRRNYYGSKSPNDEQLSISPGALPAVAPRTQHPHTV